MRVGHPNPDIGGKRRAEQTTQAAKDATCGFHLLGAGHEAVKEKPKTAAAQGLCNRKLS